MNFKVFGDINNKAIILIHGAFVSWNMWSEQIKIFTQDYFVIVPILDGHDIERKSIFTTIQKASSDIADYVCQTHGNNVFAVIGCSLGGVIATEILAQKRLNIEKAIIDGAYLTTMKSWICRVSAKIMVRQFHLIKKGNKLYKYIISLSFSKKAVDDIYKLSSNMNDEICENIAFSNYSYVIPNSISNTTTNIAFWYGEKEKRFVGKSAKQLSRLLPSARIEEFKGLGHGDLISKNPDLFNEKAYAFFVAF